MTCNKPSTLHSGHTDCGPPDTDTKTVFVSSGDFSSLSLGEKRLCVCIMVTKDVLVGNCWIVVVNVERRVVVRATIVVCEVGEDGLRDVGCCLGKVVVVRGNGPRAGSAFDKGDVGGGGDIVGAAV